MDLKKIGILTSKRKIGYVLKHTPEDFVVWELGDSNDIASNEEPIIDVNILKKFFPAKIAESLANMKHKEGEKDTKVLLAEVEAVNKAERTILHQEFKKNPLLISQYEDNKLKIFKNTEKAIFSFILKKEKEDTVEACIRISKELKVPFKNIKFAGNKDRNAITFQRISISDVYYDDIRALCCVRRERGHLRLGKFEGNKFWITVRPDKGPINDDAISLEKAMNLLNPKTISKIPNFFGQQRFGRNLDNHLVGKKLQEKKYSEVVDLIMQVKEYDGPFVIEAKKSFLEKEYDRAYKAIS